MSTKHLDILFNPKRIAVIGASEDDKAIGCHIFRNLIGKGFKGIVHPISRGMNSIQGVEAYNSVNDIPHPIDLALVATHPKDLQTVLKECGQKAVKGVAIMTLNYDYHAQETALITEQIKKLSSSYGCRVLGSQLIRFSPSCHSS